MSVTLNPTVCSARKRALAAGAGSLHEDRDRPHAVLHRLAAASSAASCAANGVLLREPLKPREPALDQATVFPFTSVIVTTVLLNVDWM